ncbi:hypothetical protein [Nocardia otitidiscaviarum]|nr:hypothetical protein [Nocardia otitidiscaviarum]
MYTDILPGGFVFALLADSVGQDSEAVSSSLPVPSDGMLAER